LGLLPDFLSKEPKVDGNQIMNLYTKRMQHQIMDMHMKSRQRFTNSLAKMKFPALDLGSSEKSIPADTTFEADSSGRRLERGGQRASEEAVFPATAHGGRRRPIISRDGLGGRERSVRGSHTRGATRSRRKAAPDHFPRALEVQWSVCLQE
jgi:hypothetical protein